MHSLRLIAAFIRASAQQDLAYRANFWISLLHSLLNLGMGLLGLQVIFSQVSDLRGWSLNEARVLLGVFLVASALRSLFIGPSLEALVGLGQEVWSGNFDFTLLKPVPTQFLVTFRQWRLFALVDLGFGMGVLVLAAGETARDASSALVFAGQAALFLAAMTAGFVTLYAILLAFTALVFWSPGYLFTWVFDAIFQLARYPISIYPSWLRDLLTWLIPVGAMVSIPAQILTGKAGLATLAASLLLSCGFLVGASALFSRALRRYSSASS